MEKTTSTNDTTATGEQRDHLNAQRTPEHMEMTMRVMHYDEPVPIEKQLRRWRIVVWTAILLAVLGIGYLIHQLVRVSGTMFR